MCVFNFSSITHIENMPSSQPPTNNLLPNMHTYFPPMPSYNSTIKHRSTIKRQEEPQTERILAQPVAQAEEPRPGESLSLRRVLFA